uniref:Cytochrome c oxidase subunit 5A, mitochondrial n=1 Tax=Amazona collaria TaxID=241587 RepID=A0A8B9GDP0_9PSIT
SLVLGRGNIPVSCRNRALRKLLLSTAVLHARCYSHGSQESDEEFDARWVTYFNKPDIDAWELRKGELSGKGRVTTE